MPRYRVPASTTNLGHGFDCLGLALALSNTIDVEPLAGQAIETPESRDAGLAAMVARVREASDSLAAQIQADSAPILISMPSMFPPAVPSMPPRAPSTATGVSTSGAALGRSTAEYRVPTARLQTTDGRTFGPIAYPELVELVASGKISADDRVDLGDGFVALREIEDLAGHLGPRKTTMQFVDAGTPDWCASAAEPSDAHGGADAGAGFALGWIAARAATGVLFATIGERRREAYFHGGRLSHVPTATTDAESRAAITLLFSMREGDLAFYRGAEPDAADRVAIPVGPLVEGAVAATLGDDAAVERRRSWRSKLVALDVPASLRDAGWSRLVERVLEHARTAVDPSTLVDTFDEDPRDVVRAIESARLARMLGIAS